MPRESSIFCLNVGDNVAIIDKCDILSCPHNDQNTKYGCIQYLHSRKSTPADIMHRLGHDRKMKAASERRASAKLTIVGKILYDVQCANLKERPFETAFKARSIIRFQQARRACRELPTFFRYIDSVYWISILEKYGKQMVELEIMKAETLSDLSDEMEQK